MAKVQLKNHRLSQRYIRSEIIGLHYFNNTKGIPMKKVALISLAILYISGCGNNGEGTNIKINKSEPENKIIELTCTPENYGSPVYISINVSTKSVLENGRKTENVLLENGRIAYETTDEGIRFIVKVDRTSGKMEVKSLNGSETKLNFQCELVKPKF